MPRDDTRLGWPQEPVLQALSVSRSVWRQLQIGSLSAQMLAAFEHACHLLTAEGNLIALVLPQIGNGPFNIVVDGTPGDFSPIRSGTAARLDASSLRVDGLAVTLDGAEIWESRPDWDSLRSGNRVDSECLRLLQALVLRHAPKGSLLLLLAESSSVPPAGSHAALRTMDCRLPDFGEGSLSHSLITVARPGADALRAGWPGDPIQLRTGATCLAGLGGGLTPAGDDFLAGVMLWAWLAHPAPQQFCEILLEAAAPRTTALSAAFLQAAARGECSASWHRLLTALQRGSQDRLAEAARDALSHGHTSGADTLAGFLWLGLQTRGDRVRAG